MDLTSIVIGLICCALFVVPVIYIQSVQKNKTRKFLADFINLARQEQVMVTEHDLWKHRYAIGIDPVSNKLFYLKKSADDSQEVVVSLYDIAACSLINVNRNINSNLVIDRLELQLSFRNARLPKRTLAFYNSEDSLPLNDELRLVQKWNTLINASIEASKMPGLAV